MVRVVQLTRGREAYGGEKRIRITISRIRDRWRKRWRNRVIEELR